MGFFSKFKKKEGDVKAAAPAKATEPALASAQPAKQPAASPDEIAYVQGTWQQIFPMTGPNNCHRKI